MIGVFEILREIILYLLAYLSFLIDLDYQKCEQEIFCMTYKVRSSRYFGFSRNREKLPILFAAGTFGNWLKLNYTVGSVGYFAMISACCKSVLLEFPSLHILKF
jgi:hypothetical protein